MLEVAIEACSDIEAYFRVSVAPSSDWLRSLDANVMLGLRAAFPLWEKSSADYSSRTTAFETRPERYTPTADN